MIRGNGLGASTGRKNGQLFRPKGNKASRKVFCYREPMMDEEPANANLPPLEIRSSYGITDFSYRSREWNGVVVYHVTHHHSPGRAWQSLSSHQATVAVVLEQVGG